METKGSRGDSGHVYLIRMGRFYKIGASKNPEARLRDFQNLPEPVELVHSLTSRNHYQIETALHHRFADCRVAGEWFLLTDEHVEAIRRIATCHLVEELPVGLRPPQKHKPDTNDPGQRPRRSRGGSESAKRKGLVGINFYATPDEAQIIRQAASVIGVSARAFCTQAILERLQIFIDVNGEDHVAE